MGGAVFSLLFTWGQTMVEVMKIMATSFKRSHAHITTLSAPQPWSWLPPTHASAGDSWTLTGRSGSVSHRVTAPFCWVLVSTRFCLSPPRVYFQSCVNFGSSMVGLMVTSSKRAYAIPKSAAPRAPTLAGVHCWPVPPQEILERSSVSGSVGSLGPGAHKVCLIPLSISGGYEVWV